MNLDEIVGKVIKRRRSLMVPQFPGKSIRQASVTSHGCSDGPILSFNVAGRNMLWVRLPHDFMDFNSDALGGRVTMFLLRFSVDFLQHGIIDIGSKGILYRFKVRFVAVRRQLHSEFQPCRQIVYKFLRFRRIPSSESPASDQFAIGINCRSQPNIARIRMLSRNIFGAVFFFAINPTPHFIQLQTAALEVLENQVLVLSAERADLVDQTHHGLFGHACYADGGADAVSFNQATDDLGALFGSEPVHMSSMPYGSRIVNTFEIK